MPISIRSDAQRQVDVNHQRVRIRESMQGFKDGRWTTQEIERLRDLYGVASPVELEVTFQRSYGAIKRQAHRYGIKKARTA